MLTLMQQLTFHRIAWTSARQANYYKYKMCLCLQHFLVVQRQELEETDAHDDGWSRHGVTY